MTFFLQLQLSFFFSFVLEETINPVYASANYYFKSHDSSRKHVTDSNNSCYGQNLHINRQMNDSDKGLYNITIMSLSHSLLFV